MRTLPLKYESISPEERYLFNQKIQKIKIKFEDDIQNLSQINCFSNEGVINGETLKISFAKIMF